MEKLTALYEKHVAHGGRMVPFAGYMLPVQYPSGIIAEHSSVRKAAGLFDVSHMGELWLTGRDALANLNNWLTNDFSNMQAGKARYSPMCYENGGTVDDLLVYKFDEEKYYIVVNAANKDKDFAWMRQSLRGDVSFSDVSDMISQLALQGPCAPAILAKLAKAEYIPQKYYTFIERCFIEDIPCLISKTGYTGETGYEIYCENKYAEKLFDLIVAAGEEYGLLLCGLGCRDTLRLEAGMPLYGHELSADITPKEAGLAPFIKMDKDDFIGKAALMAPRARRRIGLKMTDRGIAREGALLYDGEREIGFVSSGTSSPTLGAAIAMGYVAADYDKEALCVNVRGKLLHAEIVTMPFYKAGK